MSSCQYVSQAAACGGNRYRAAVHKQEYQGDSINNYFIMCSHDTCFQGCCCSGRSSQYSPVPTAAMTSMVQMTAASAKKNGNKVRGGVANRTIDGHWSARSCGFAQEDEARRGEGQGGGALLRELSDGLVWEQERKCGRPCVVGAALHWMMRALKMQRGSLRLGRESAAKAIK